MLPIALVVVAMALLCSNARAGEPIESCAGSELATAQQPPDDLNCSIGGTQYLDRDADGSRDPDEPGLAGWTIYVDLDGSGQHESGEPSAVSGADGSYAIPIPFELAAVPLAVSEELQPGWSCSAPAPVCSYAEQPFLDDDPEQEPQLQRNGRDFGATPLTQQDGAPATSAAKGSSGLARLSAVAACPSRFVRMSVRGRGVANVSYFLDGQKLMTVIKPDSRGRFGYRIRSARITPGVHRIRAQVTFTAASATASRTLDMAVQKCRPAKPRFAG
jgi:hypothetical protein